MERTPHLPCGAVVTLFGTGAVVGAGLLLLAVILGWVPGLGPAAGAGEPGAAVATAAPTDAPTPAPGEPRYVRELPIPLTDTDTATPDVLLEMQSSGGGQTVYNLVYLEGDSRAIRWKSPPLGEHSYEREVVAGPELVFVADGARLSALSRRDGSVAWERSLSDTLTNICHECLKIAGDHVVALSQDGVLQGFEAKTGGGGWSVRLNEVPRQLVVLGARVGVLDYAKKDSGDATLLLFNPADGTRARTPDTACPNDDPNWVEYPGIYDRLYPAPDGKSVFAVVRGSAGCIMQIGADGAPVWATPTGDTPLESGGEGEVVLAPDALYVGANGVVMAADLSTGAIREVARDEDYHLAPVAARGGLVLVDAVRTRGSRRSELWALDAQSGQRRWGVVLLGDDHFASADDDGDWAVVPGPDAFVLLQAQEQGGTQIDVLRAADGSAVKSASIERDDSFGWQGVVWTEREAWITYDRVYVLDLASADLRYSWP